VIQTCSRTQARLALSRFDGVVAAFPG
jgi:hypothetical protein